MEKKKSPPRYKISISAWGPAAWHFLTSVAFTYPKKPNETDKKIYRDFFTLVKNVLPCKMCRAHYAEHLEKEPLKLDSCRQLTEWVIGVHNDVNRRTGRRVIPYTECVADYLPRSMFPNMDLTSEELQKAIKHSDEMDKKHASGGKKEEMALSSPPVFGTSTQNSMIPVYIWVLLGFFAFTTALFATLFISERRRGKGAKSG